MNILTRGLGKFTKLLTRGFGKEERKNMFGPSAKRKKEYTFEIYVNIIKSGEKEFDVNIPIRIIQEKQMLVKSKILKKLKETINIKSKTNYKKLIDMIEFI